MLGFDNILSKCLSALPGLPGLLRLTDIEILTTIDDIHVELFRLDTYSSVRP